MPKTLPYLLLIATIGMGCGKSAPSPAPCGEWVQRREWKLYPACPQYAGCMTVEFVAFNHGKIIAYYDGTDWREPDGHVLAERGTR